MTSHQRSHRPPDPAPRSPIRRRLQAKLSIGAVDDPMEVEAERTADRVLAAIQSSTPAVPATASRASVDEEEPLQGLRSLARASSEDEEPLQGLRTATRATPEDEEEPLQGLRTATRAAVGPEGGEVDADLEARLTGGSGAPLPEPVRATMETAFGADFSAVRVRNNPAAAEIGARAYTMGADIHFAPGQFTPDTPAGQHLLAHELTHVVQQGAAAARSPEVRRSVVDQLDADDLTALQSKVCHDAVAHVVNKTTGKNLTGAAVRDLGGTIAHGPGGIPDGAVINFMGRGVSAKSFDDLFATTRHTMISVGGGKAWGTNNSCLGGPPNWAELSLADLVTWEPDQDGELRAWAANEKARIPQTEVMVVWSMP